MYTSAKFVDDRIKMQNKEYGEAQVGLHYKVGRWPLWLEKDAIRLSKTVLRQEAERMGALNALINEYNEHNWFDHPGLLQLRGDNEQVLIVEPYGISHESINEIMRFASDLNLRVQIEAAGSWYPTHTVRLLFFKNL